jgi:hypothetical protein
MTLRNQSNRRSFQRANATNVEQGKVKYAREERDQNITVEVWGRWKNRVAFNNAPLDSGKPPHPKTRTVGGNSGLLGSIGDLPRNDGVSDHLGQPHDLHVQSVVLIDLPKLVPALVTGGHHRRSRSSGATWKSSRGNL